MRQQQFLLLIAGAVIVFLLYKFGSRTNNHLDETPLLEETVLSIEEYVSKQKQSLYLSERKLLDSIEQEVSVNKHDTLNKLITLSNSWENIGNYSIGAYYQYLAAKKTQTKMAWIESGDKLTEAYENYADSAITNNLVNFALASYEAALKIDGQDLGVRMKLADTYVNGTQDPMKGITILKNITDSLPEYIPALLSLGRLSIVSGQYKKAENRLSKILSLEPLNAEANYFMAIAQEGLGNNEQAIEYFEMCKSLVPNPAFHNEIDGYIKNLKNN